MKNNKNYIFAGVLILVLLSLACGGQAQVQDVRVESLLEVMTREAAEVTAAAQTPTVAASAGSVAVPVIAENPQDALWQMKDVLARHATYATVDITVVSGQSIVLTATYEAGRTRGVLWDADWTPTVYTMRGSSTVWNGDDRFWGDTP